jgi:hypothetical protein
MFTVMHHPLVHPWLPPLSVQPHQPHSQPPGPEETAATAAATADGQFGIMLNDAIMHWINGKW